MLVSVRDSGSLLPQAGLIPFVRRYRKHAWTLGSVLQGIAVVGIGLAAAFLTELAAGPAILGALTIFSLSRTVSSISSRGLVGKTVPKGNRGSVLGIAASVAALVAIGAGFSSLWGSTDPTLPSWPFWSLLQSA